MVFKWPSQTRFQLFCGGPNATVTDPGVGCESGVTLTIHKSAAPVEQWKEGGWTKYKVPGTYVSGEGDFPGYNAGDFILEATLEGSLSGDPTDAKLFCASATSGVPAYDNAPVPYKYNGMAFGDLASPPPPIEDQ